MRLTAFTAFGLLAGVSALDKPLDIEKTHSVNCHKNYQTKEGDLVSMHYRGTLEKDGKEFDASYNRGTPLEFTIGKGQVIKGWDQGLLNMCVGDKRKLTIQPEFGYGARAMGPIPANSVLIFETELMAINGKGQSDTKAEI